VGSTFSVGLDASDGDYSNRTKLSWNDLSDVADEIRIERSIPGTNNREELAILTGTARAFNDQDGIPGFGYTYYVTPLDGGTPWLTDSDVGYSRPNGKISGHVRSSLGAGVEGVDVYIQLASTILAGGAPLLCDSATYCTQTDASGYYEVDDVYYFTEATFRIYPKKGGPVPHVFTPDTLERDLNENYRSIGGVDFTDETVLTVGGRVTYPLGPGQSIPCGVEDVRIFIDGNDSGVRTDEMGYWLTSLPDQGTHAFSAVLHDHRYENPSGNTVTTRYVDQDMTDIDFENVTLRSFQVIAQAGCFASLGDSVKVRVATAGNCFTRDYRTGPTGVLTIDSLAPREYTVQVIDIIDPVSQANEDNILDQIGQPVSIDLTKLDTMEVITTMDSLIITPAQIIPLPGGGADTIPEDIQYVEYQDTTYTTEKTLRFIYRPPIEIDLDLSELAVVPVCPSDSVYVMEQGVPYFLQFQVREIILDPSNVCYVDTGTLVIYDQVSDREGGQIRVPISNGLATYIVDPGTPNLAPDHTKYLYVIPEVDFAEPDPQEYWFVVTGIKNGTSTFVSGTPDIPQLVIHDPPGDNSFATIEKGTTFTTVRGTEIKTGGDAEIYANIKGGPAFKLFQTSVKAGGLVEFKLKAGRDNFDNDVTVTTTTFLESFSTSSGSTFVGHDGDVYIGYAVNQIFSISQELAPDTSGCGFRVDSVVVMNADSFTTTFIYTEYHVRNSLLPTLEILRGLADTTTMEGRKDYNKHLRNYMMWDSILIRSAWYRDSLAKRVENISFSAGADFTREKESSTGINNSFNYTAFVETSLKVGVLAELEFPGTFLEVEGGVTGAFRWSQTEVRDTTNESTRKVTFTLSDDDIGDYFTVDILQDTVFDVPAFRVLAGASSCPHEPNTQARENPEIVVFPPVRNNVPPDETAKFVLKIRNFSESGETRQYAVKLDATTNPDGAIVNVAGSDVNVFPVAYFFDANQEINLAMEVTKGPLAANYDSIGIFIYSECELDIWDDGGSLTRADTAWFSVNFLSECSNVAMHLPYDGWVVNQANNNLLHTAFTGYDLGNASLESLTLQVKRKGEGYIDQVTIPRESLIGPYYTHLWDVSTFPDGEYTLRARANCGEGGVTYSSEVSGIIDRNSLAPFGTPTPADGFLREGQEVSVTFDKPIDCGFAGQSPSYTTEITLYREDTGTPIAFTAQCAGNKVILQPDTPLIDRTDLDGKLVRARVHLLRDLSGNVQEYPTEWSFLVNVSPVFWDPEDVAASGMEGNLHTITGVLKNTSLLSKAFSLDPGDAPAIIEYPEWLVPLQSRGTILPNNDYSVQFAVDPDLLPGVYSGIVTALVDELPVSMNVTFELLARPVNWPFDPSQYEYTMNVVAQFSLDGTNDNLSEDSRDLVGAFVNGQVRGVANIQYVPEINAYRAFLTVHSNNQGGGGAETVNFRFWRALTGVEYSAIETRTFTLDQTHGTVASPLILHPEGFFQIIPLRKGWNWISLNLATSNMSRERIFNSILASPSGNSITVKSKTQSAQYSQGSGWNGNLGSLQLGSGYLVHLSNAPDTLRVAGLPSASDIIVPVSGNWNWIGFPRLTPEPVNDVLSGLSPATGNILKGQNLFAAYDAAVPGWVGNLAMFRPNDGYKLYLTNPGNIVFESSRDGYAFDAHLYEYNMNVTGYADLDLIGERDDEDFIVGAFIDGTCRGVAEAEWVEALQAWRYLLLVNGNIDDLGLPIEFRLLNDATGAEYTGNGPQLSFTADGLIGTVAEPYPFLGMTTSLLDPITDGYHLEQNQPNPVNGSTQISFRLPVSGHATLVLYDLTGKPLRVLADQDYPAGRHTVQANLDGLPAGVYMYELQTGEFSGVRKLMKR